MPQHLIRRRGLEALDPLRQWLAVVRGNLVHANGLGRYTVDLDGG